MNQPESFVQTSRSPLAAVNPANGCDTCTPSAGDVISPSLTFKSPSNVSAAGSIAVAEEGDDSFLGDVSAAGSIAAVEVGGDIFLNLFAILVDAVPDTFFVIEDVPSPSPPVCIVDSVERGRVVPSDPSVHVAVSTTCTSSSYCCLICLKSFKSSYSSPPLWQHLNSISYCEDNFLQSPLSSPTVGWYVIRRAAIGSTS